MALVALTVDNSHGSQEATIQVETSFSPSQDQSRDGKSQGSVRFWLVSWGKDC